MSPLCLTRKINLVSPLRLVFALIGTTWSSAHAYQICKVEGPTPPREPGCLVHFSEGSVTMDARALREVESCMKQLQWASELELVGHADACRMDVDAAAQRTGTRVVTSRDTGNSILGEGRLSSVSTEISRVRGAYGARGTATLYISNEADESSTGHDSNDRTVEIRSRKLNPGCVWNYVFDGSGSMEQAWPGITGVRYPEGACFHIVIGDGQRCPARLVDYRPYGATYIYSAVAERFLNKSKVVVLSDFNQPEARAEEISKVSAALRAGKIQVWLP